MCCAPRLMVFNVCVKFHENMSSGFKVMERTQKLLTDTHTHTQRKDENIIPPRHTLYAGGINMENYPQIVPVTPYLDTGDLQNRHFIILYLSDYKTGFWSSRMTSND